MRDELLSVWPNDGTVKTVLDLGCRDCWHTAGLPGVIRHVGVEVWPAALERGRQKAAAGGIPNFEPVHDNALAYLRARTDNDFDAVLAVDLVEHLERQDAVDLLDEMARVASQLAVVWTTLGYIPQAAFDVDGNPNPFEEHRWGPTPDVFTERGWQIRVHPLWHEARGGAILAWLSK